MTTESLSALCAVDIGYVSVKMGTTVAKSATGVLRFVGMLL